MFSHEEHGPLLTQALKTPWCVTSGILSDVVVIRDTKSLGSMFTRTILQINKFNIHIHGYIQALAVAPSLSSLNQHVYVMSDISSVQSMSDIAAGTTVSQITCISTYELSPFLPTLVRTHIFAPFRLFPNTYDEDELHTEYSVLAMDVQTVAENQILKPDTQEEEQIIINVAVLEISRYPGYKVSDISGADHQVCVYRYPTAATNKYEDRTGPLLEREFICCVRFHSQDTNDASLNQSTAAWLRGSRLTVAHLDCQGTLKIYRIDHINRSRKHCKLLVHVNDLHVTNISFLSENQVLLMYMIRSDIQNQPFIKICRTQRFGDLIKLIRFSPMLVQEWDLNQNQSAVVIQF